MAAVAGEQRLGIGEGLAAQLHHAGADADVVRPGQLVQEVHADAHHHGGAALAQMDAGVAEEVQPRRLEIDAIGVVVHMAQRVGVGVAHALLRPMGIGGGIGRVELSHSALRSGLPAT
jgi:hypothetical protein